MLGMRRFLLSAKSQDFVDLARRELRDPRMKLLRRVPIERSQCSREQLAVFVGFDRHKKIDHAIYMRRGRARQYAIRNRDQFIVLLRAKKLRRPVRLVVCRWQRRKPRKVPHHRMRPGGQRSRQGRTDSRKNALQNFAPR